MAQIKVKVQDQLKTPLPGALIGGDNYFVAKTDSQGIAIIETSGATRFTAKLLGHQSQTFPVSSIPPIIILQKPTVVPVTCEPAIIDDFQNKIPMLNLQPSSIRTNTPPDTIVNTALSTAVSKTVQVIDSDNQPLESVNIALSNGQGVITDASGIFRLNQVPGNLTATISHVASPTAEQFLVKDLPTVVQLDTTNNLDEVTVSANIPGKTGFSTANIGWILAAIVAGTIIFKPQKKGLNQPQVQSVIIN